MDHWQSEKLNRGKAACLRQRADEGKTGFSRFQRGQPDRRILNEVIHAPVGNVGHSTQINEWFFAKVANRNRF